ncbi:hypothetical protein GCM10027418_32190 [Mariniluteicoccus endophyticus]
MNLSKRILVGAAAVVATAGVVAPVGLVTANAAVAPSVRPGQQDARVASIQYLLRAHGYSLVTDAHYGSTTVNAVKAFEKAKGLKVDGIADAEVQAHLALRVQRGDTGVEVRALQALLRHHGYKIVTDDGDFSWSDHNAVVDFQRKKGLTANGVAEWKTWRALFGGSSDSAPAPTTPPRSGDITRADLEAMFPGKVAATSRVQEGLPGLNAEMRARGITTPKRKAAFLATLANESGFDYGIVQNRSDHYRGRGYIQLTGEYNYQKASAFLGVDLTGANADRAAYRAYSAKIAGWYWQGYVYDSNAAADAFDMGRVSRYIGYGWGNPAEYLPEDRERCTDFKVAYKYLSGSSAPASTVCERH